MRTFTNTALAIVLSIAVVSCTKQDLNSTSNPFINESSTGNNGQAVHQIGEKFGGGVIFYLDDTKQHGLIAATKDQSTGIKWYNNSYVLTGATATGINKGAGNTTKIVNKQGNSGNYAAKLCADLVLNGFSDWYLPSKGELNQLYKQRSKVPNLSATNYWSSTESDINNAFDQEFGGGFTFADDKSFTIHVRAIRSF